MDDPILPTEPAPVPTPPAPDPISSRFERLENSMANLANVVETVGNRLLQAPAQAPPKTADEVFSEMAQDPMGLMQRVASDVMDRKFAGTMGPAASSVFDTVNRQMMAAHQSQIDYDFGEGAYEEYFKPQLDKDIAGLRQVNPQAVADQPTIEALVHRIYGQKFQELRQRREALEKTAANRGLSHLIPTGGVPRLRIGNPQEELTNDHELFIKETDRATGQRTDPKTFAKLLHSGTQSGPERHRTSLQDFADVMGMTKEQKEKYGLS